jgi:tetratricopeptide (TPR) repeat protein
MFRDGFTAYQAGKFSEAEALFNKGLETKPKDGRAWYYLGLTEMALGKADAGQKSLANAKSIGVTSAATGAAAGTTAKSGTAKPPPASAKVEAAFLPAFGAYQAKEYPKAESLFQKALKTNPKDGNGWYYLALTQLELGKFDEAQKSLARAGKSGVPSEKVASAGLGLVMRRKVPKEVAAKLTPSVLSAVESDRALAVPPVRGTLRIHYKMEVARLTSVGGQSPGPPVQVYLYDVTYSPTSSGLGKGVWKRQDLDPGTGKITKTTTGACQLAASGLLLYRCEGPVEQTLSTLETRGRLFPLERESQFLWEAYSDDGRRTQLDCTVGNAVDARTIASRLPGRATFVDCIGDEIIPESVKARWGFKGVKRFVVIHDLGLGIEAEWLRDGRRTPPGRFPDNLGMFQSETRCKVTR